MSASESCKEVSTVHAKLYHVCGRRFCAFGQPLALKGEMSLQLSAVGSSAPRLLPQPSGQRLGRSSSTFSDAKPEVAISDVMCHEAGVSHLKHARDQHLHICIREALRQTQVLRRLRPATGPLSLSWAWACQVRQGKARPAGMVEVGFACRLQKQRRFSHAPYSTLVSPTSPSRVPDRGRHNPLPFPKLCCQRPAIFKAVWWAIDGAGGNRNVSRHRADVHVFRHELYSTTAGNGVKVRVL